MADRAVVGAVGAAVVGVQVDDQLGVERADRQREGLWLAVGVAGVGVSQTGFRGDLETRDSSLERGISRYAQSEEVPR